MEVFANLRLLHENHTPLRLSFDGRAQRFQSFLVKVDRDRQMFALDEVVPNDGERLLLSGETLLIEANHDGVRVVWECHQQAAIGEIEGNRCYWLSMPDEVHYHQRRGAYRAALKQNPPVEVSLAGGKLNLPLKGQMLDISATGCKLRLEGNVDDRLQTGQVYEHMTTKLPFGTITVAVELRHLRYDDQLNKSFAGLRFFRIPGTLQRQIERFVYQLQREARRLEA